MLKINSRNVQSFTRLPTLNGSTFGLDGLLFACGAADDLTGYLEKTGNWIRDR
jgi:hypothetical protein